MSDLQEQLRELADRRADEAGGDFESVVSTARSRKHRRTAVWSVAAAVVTTAAVVTGTSAWNQPKPLPAAPPVTADQLVLTPATVSPKQRFTATLPDGISRGVMFGMHPVIKSPHGFALRGQAPGVTIGPASWKTTEGTASTGLIIPAYQGPGPFVLVVPDEAGPGQYRVCSRELCGLLTVR
ncbi:hypothetical protein ACI2LF_02225 [Kribbella sp. NPDC020789]